MELDLGLGLELALELGLELGLGTTLESTSAPLRMKKVTRRPPTLQVFATARATSVLPVPGGP